MADLVPPRDTFLGDLSLTEVYFAFEGPRIFLAESKVGHLYFAFIVDDDDDTESYIYLPVSSRRLGQLRSGGIGLREAVLHPEDSRLFLVVANYDADVPFSTAKALLPDDLPVNWLPDQDARLRAKTPTKPPFSPAELSQMSSRENRPLFAIEVEPSTVNRTEIPVKSFGRIGIAVQETIDAIAQAEFGAPTVRGAIRNEILEQVELCFTESLAASFVFVLAHNTDDGLFQTPLLSDSLVGLGRLLNSGASSAPDLSRELTRYGPRVLSKYRSLLDSVLQEETGIQTFFATPGSSVISSGLTLAEVKHSLKVLDDSDPTTRHFSLSGVTLVGVNLRTGVFEIREVDADRSYVGKLTPSGRAAIEGLPTGGEFLYKADLVEVTEYSSVTDEEKTVYRLENVEQVS